MHVRVPAGAVTEVPVVGLQRHALVAGQRPTSTLTLAAMVRIKGAKAARPARCGPVRTVVISRSSVTAERQTRRRSPPVLCQPGLAEARVRRRSGQSHALASGLATNCVVGAFGVTDLGGG
jgi:hypothetical protein